MPHDPFRRSFLTLLVVSAVVCQTANADDAPAGSTKDARLTSDAVVLGDAIHRLEWADGKLYLLTQTISANDREVHRIETKFQPRAGLTVSQLAVTNYRDIGMIGAIKSTGAGTSEFTEFASWRDRVTKELGKRTSFFTFLTTEKRYEILAVSSRRSQGVFVVLGNESELKGKDLVFQTEGFIYFDGCPWPCLGGALSPFKGKSIPLEAQLPFHETQKQE